MNAISVTRDRFSADAISDAFWTSDDHVRRMTRGIVLHDDTFATLRLVAGSGKNKLIVDAGSRRKDANQQPLTINGKRATDVYSNFLLQQVNEERAEKTQILETFGEPYIFLFGERARVITFSGILANTFDFNWEAEWWYNYDQFLRGTKCVENDARIFLSFDNTLVGGYIIAANASKVATERNWVNFTFQLFVTSYSSFTDLGNPYAKPGTRVAVNDKFTNTETASLTAAQAAQFRPSLLDNTISTQAGVQQANGGFLSLAEGVLASGVQKLTSAWNAIDQVTNNVLRDLSDLVSGSVVRVPVGFAGTMAYDSVAAENKDPRLVSTYGPVTYSTFADNYDEFVGSSDHYGSSSPSANSILTPSDSLSDRLTYGQGLVDKAKQQWSDNGYAIPDDQLGPVSAFLVGKGLGMVAVGATRDWQQFTGGTGDTTAYNLTSSGGAFQHAPNAIDLG